MKDGSDGERLDFKLKVIPLGLDADGEEISSCIVEHIDSAPGGKPSKSRPSGRLEIQMYAMLKTMAPSGSVHYDDLTDGYVAKMPKGPGERDNRKRDAKRAIEGLIAKKLAHMHEGERVSLTSLITSGDDGWLG